MDEKVLPGTKPLTQHNQGGYREGEPLNDAEIMGEVDGAAAKEPMAAEVPEIVQHGPINSEGPAGRQENAKKTAIG